MREMVYPVAVIGAGASGMAAAIEAAGVLGPGKVLLLERGQRAGRKLLATGNGRCNLANRQLSAAHYHGHDSAFVLPALTRYPLLETIGFFGQMGLYTVDEAGGKIFPMPLQAAAVLDVLRLELERRGVLLQTDTDAAALRPGKGGFSIACRTPGGEAVFHARKVVAACGGEASPNLGGCTGGYKLLAALGHPVYPTLPAIVQLRADVSGVKGLSGSKFDAAVTLFACGKKPRPIRDERGELLFTDYGVSGPPVMQLSGHAARALEAGEEPFLSVDFLPDWEAGEVRSALYQRKKALSGRKLEDFMTGFLPKRLGQLALKMSGAAPLSRTGGTLSPGEIEGCVQLLKSFRLYVTGTGGMKNAQVTQGGVSTACFDPATLQSRKVPGLYACGELLDIDGDCGGYNLQWAWSSGRLAGRSAAASIG